MVMTVKLVVLVALTLVGTVGTSYEMGLLVPDGEAPMSKVLPMAGRCYYDPRIFPCGFDAGIGQVGQSVPDAVPLPFPNDDFALVTWAGQDNPDGNGIKCFDVQYRFGSSGEWVDWKTGTEDMCAIFTPDDAGMLYFHEGTYYFRCRAVDYSGNTEAFPRLPDARFDVTYYTPFENVEAAWKYWHNPPVKALDGASDLKIAAVDGASDLKDEAVDWYDENIVSVPETPVQDAVGDGLR
jgi:hypothetical protein